MFGGNFAPAGWALCSGQLLTVQQYTALFSLVGTSYGGNGTSTFGLPNLMGVTPLGVGSGPGLTPYVVGETAGALQTVLTVSQLPPHSHAMVVDSGAATSNAASGTLPGAGTRGSRPAYYSATTPSTPSRMSPQMIAPNAPGWSGNPAAFSVVQPFLTITMVIALTGLFPARN